MNKKIVNILKILVIICIIICLVLSSIVSQDNHHLEICEAHNCSVCAIIHLAQTIINLTLAICIYAVVMFLIFYFLSEIHIESFSYVSNSLVFQKVQLNE